MPPPAREPPRDRPPDRRPPARRARRRADPLDRPRRPPGRAARRAGRLRPRRWQAAAARVLPLGLRRRRAATPTTRPGSTPAPRWSCSTPSPSSTTTSWTARDLRRGHATVHRDFEHRHRRPGAGGGEARRFGEGVAILSATWPSCTPTSCSTTRRPRCAVFTELRVELNVGQYLDLLGSRQPGDRHRHRPGASPATSRPSTRSSGRCTSAPRSPAADRPARRPQRRRAPARRGVPAARRPARRVRRPGGHRQAGRRRPPRGQAHTAARGGRPAGPRSTTTSLAVARCSASAIPDLDRGRRRRAPGGSCIDTGAVAEIEARDRAASVDAALAALAVVDRHRRSRAASWPTLATYVAWRTG